VVPFERSWDRCGPGASRGPAPSGGKWSVGDRGLARLALLCGPGGGDFGAAGGVEALGREERGDQAAPEERVSAANRSITLVAKM
jgi:hypothetical protein